MSTPSQTAQMVRMYEQGASLSQVGAAFGMDLNAARYILKKAGVTFRPRGGIVRYDAATRAEAVRLYPGMDTPEIAVRLGVAQSTIWEWLHAAGVDMSRQGRTATQAAAPPQRPTPWQVAKAAELEDMATMRESGASLAQIAQEYDVTPQAVHSRLRGTDVEPPPPAVRPEKARAVAMYRDGQTIPAIAVRLGVAKSTVSLWIKAAAAEGECDAPVRGQRHPGGHGRFRPAGTR